jgi:Tfp pilus assembly protein PilF
MGHHLTSIVLHGLNTFLVVILAIYLLRVASNFKGIEGLLSDRRIFTAGVITGLLFGLHPLHVESVAWVSERKDVLCAFFFLLSIMSYMSYTTYKTYTNYLLCLGFFILALLSKPMAVTLPAVLLIMDWYPFRRFEGNGRLKSIFIEKLPFFAISIALAAITLLAQRSGGAIKSLDMYPLPDRILVGFKALGSYLGKMLWPTRLSPFYPYPQNAAFFSYEYLLSVLLVVGITLACIALLKRQSVWLAIWGYYVITLLPVLGIIQVGGQAMADRYIYLPSIGPFLFIGLVVALVFEKLTASVRWNMMMKVFTLSIATILTVFMSYTTVKQIGIWKDGITLWSRAIEIDPIKVDKAYYNRGLIYKNTGRFQEALKDLTQAIRIGIMKFAPGLHRSYGCRAAVYTELGYMEEALKDYTQAINLSPTSISYFYYNNRGIVYAKFGRFEEALKDYEHAIYINPDFPALYYNRGNAYAKLERLEDALRDYTQAINISPIPNSDYYYNRGIVYKKLGHHEEAKKDFMQAEELMRKR